MTLARGGGDRSRALQLAALSAFVGLSAWSPPAGSHSWMFTSAWGTLDAGSLRCADDRCHVTLTCKRLMDTERAQRRAPTGDRRLVDVWLEPAELEGASSVADVKALVAAIAKGPVRVHGRLDSFDGEGMLDLKARFIGASPTKASDEAPFAACGTPPWKREHLEACSRKVTPRVVTTMDAVLEAPPAGHTHRFRGVVSLRDAVSEQPMFENNPWALVSKGALVLSGRRASKLTDLEAGSSLRVGGYFALPPRVKEDGKLVFACPDDMCWPRLVVTAIRADASR